MVKDLEEMISAEWLDVFREFNDKKISPKRAKQIITNMNNNKHTPVEYSSILDTSDRWEIVKYKIPDKALKGKDHIDILFWGDIHYGSKFCDEVLAKNNLDMTKERGVYIIGMGDLAETALRDSVGAGIYESTSIVHRQLEVLVEWLEPHKDRILGLLLGNHEKRIYDRVGIDINKMLCSELGVNDLEKGRLILLQVGKQNYSLYVTHGSSGATKSHTKILGCFGLQQYIEADLYAMGHVHALDSHCRAVHAIDPDTHKLVEKERVFVLTGHTLNYFGSYAQEKNLVPSRKGNPIVKFYTKEHKIRVSI